MSDKKMTCAEAGRLGGLASRAKHGSDHFRAIGRMGGRRSPARFRRGEERTRAAASLGGKAAGGFRGNSAAASAAGKKGAAARKAKRQARAESLGEIISYGGDK